MFRIAHNSDWLALPKFISNAGILPETSGTGQQASYPFVPFSITIDEYEPVN
jgi:hypothetical protein